LAGTYHPEKTAGYVRGHAQKAEDRRIPAAQFRDDICADTFPGTAVIGV
jgi:hypothetical protein